MQYEQTVALVPGFEPAALAPPIPLGPVAPVELVAVEAEEKQKKSSSTMWLATVVLCTITFLLVATSVAAVILIGSLGGRAPPTDAAESAKPGGKRGGPIFSQDIEIVVNRPESDGGPKTPRHTGQSTPPPSSRPSRVPYVPPAAPKETVDQMPMVCIMGERASTPEAFPDDGLCDYIFFDSLYKDGRNMLSRQATFSKSLSNFINNHPAYRGTHLGVGFSFNYLQSAEEDLKVKEPSPLQPLWDQRIFSVGIFDPPPMSVGNQSKAAIGTLKKIDDLLQMPKQLGHHVVTALAASDPQLDWSLAYAIDFSNIGIDPDIFIAIGHYTYGDNTVRNCAIMPPTRHPLDIPTDEKIAVDYNYDLGTALFAVKEMHAKRTRLRPLVSVTLKGRWNVLHSSDKAEFFERCVSDPSARSFGSYTEVCPDRRSGGMTKYQLTYAIGHASTLCHAPGSLRVFAYDNEDALAIKLCFIKNDEGFEDFKFGVAVYDIDYDDHDNECASLNRFGRQSRLKQVKQTLDYMRLHHDKSFNMTACTDYKE